VFGDHDERPHGIPQSRFRAVNSAARHVSAGSKQKVRKQPHAQ